MQHSATQLSTWFAAQRSRHLVGRLVLNVKIFETWHGFKSKRNWTIGM